MQIDRNQLVKVVKIVAQKMQGEKYAIRGTASLVLQGLAMGLDDIDVLCDAQTALNANVKLADYLVEPVAFKESDKFKSYYGKFLIDGVQVEIMGDWQIYNDKKGWSKIYSADAESVTDVDVDGVKIPVTKIGLELEVFARMGRWTAYQKIKRQAERTSQVGATTAKSGGKPGSNQLKLL
jgi:hypothetical protein